MNKNKPIITLDLDNALSFASIGVVRANTFIGIVLNKHNEFNIKQLRIKENVKLISEPPNDDNTLRHFKSFVVKNALCETLELFDKSLIEIFKILLIIRNKKRNFKQITDDLDKYKNNRFEKKLKILDDLLENKLSKHRDFWKNLQYTRNCITHNLEIVDKGDIKLEIPKFITILKDNVTSEETIIPLMESGITIKARNESTVIVKCKIYKKEFKIGETITFTDEELIFLIFAMQQSINDLKEILVNFLHKNDIPISIRKEDNIIQLKEK